MEELELPDAGTCNPVHTVHTYVRKALLEALQVKKDITLADLTDVAHLEAAADDEVLVPVDLQEALDQSAQNLQNPSMRLAFYVRAVELFKSNPEGAPESSRLKEVTGKEWREFSLESDPEDETSCDTEDDDDEEEGEGEEEEELAGDDGQDVEDDDEDSANGEEAEEEEMPEAAANGEPAAKRQRR